MVADAQLECETSEAPEVIPEQIPVVSCCPEEPTAPVELTLKQSLDNFNSTLVENKTCLKDALRLLATLQDKPV